MATKDDEPTERRPMTTPELLEWFLGRSVCRVLPEHSATTCGASREESAGANAMPTSEQREEMAKALRLNAVCERRHEAVLGRMANESDLMCLGGDVLDAFGDGRHISAALDGLADYVDPPARTEACQGCRHADPRHAHPWCGLWGHPVANEDFCSHWQARDG